MNKEEMKQLIMKHNIDEWNKIPNEISDTVVWNFLSLNKDKIVNSYIDRAKEEIVEYRMDKSRPIEKKFKEYYETEEARIELEMFLDKYSNKTLNDFKTIKRDEIRKKYIEERYSTIIDGEIQSINSWFDAESKDRKKESFKRTWKRMMSGTFPTHKFSFFLDLLKLFVDEKYESLDLDIWLSIPESSSHTEERYQESSFADGNSPQSCENNINVSTSINVEEGIQEPSLEEEITFQSRILGELYCSDGICLSSYMGVRFPDIAIPADDSLIKNDKNRLSLQSKFYYEECDFQNIMLSTIDPKYVPHVDKKCDMPGVMYSKIETKNNKIIGISYYIDYYSKQKLYERVLRDGFKEKYRLLSQKERDTISAQDFLKKCDFRASIYNRSNHLDSILLGRNRVSEIGLQALLFIKHKDHYGCNVVETPIIMRSDSVGEQQGMFQIPPCGAFSIYVEDPWTFSTRTLSSKFCKIYDALMMEYVEELYSKNKENETQFEYIERRVSNYGKLYTDKDFNYVNNLVLSGKVEILFLGMSTSLVSLKSDLVFAFLIDDDGFVSRSDGNFRANNEAKRNIELYSSEDIINECFVNEKAKYLTEELAAPMQLVRDNVYTCNKLKEWGVNILYKD